MPKVVQGVPFRDGVEVTTRQHRPPPDHRRTQFPIAPARVPCGAWPVLRRILRIPPRAPSGRKIREVSSARAQRVPAQRRDRGGDAASARPARLEEEPEAAIARRDRGPTRSGRGSRPSAAPGQPAQGGRRVRSEGEGRGRPGHGQAMPAARSERPWPYHRRDSASPGSGRRCRRALATSPPSIRRPNDPGESARRPPGTGMVSPPSPWERRSVHSAESSVSPPTC